MTDPRHSALSYAQNNRERFLEELKELIRIPSISTDPQRKEDMLKAAEWLAANLRSLKIENVQVMPTQGHPVVYGDWLQAGEQAPTVLIYGHYDVQPADPLDLWHSDPFTPEVRGENLFARGATDMKGQVMAVIKAIDAIVKTAALPVNVKFLLEGEEEIGSPSLDEFIRTNKELLACDFSLNTDTGIISSELPTITYALRGLAYFEIRVYGPDHDLHSGVFGGAVHNPAQALCELIAGMHDSDGRITLPGFYNRVRELEAEERAELARLPTDDAFFLRNTGAPKLWGEPDYTPAERTGARPTLEVNGLLSGFTGEGSKTVLPAWAMAKISTRLVPDQDPEEVHQQLLQYLKENAPASIRYEVVKMVGNPASISDLKSPWVAAMAQAMESVWGRRPVFRREGGSVPVVGQFQQILGVDSVNCGLAQPDDNLHSPNEKLHLPTFFRGVDTYINFFYNLKP